MLFGCGDSTVRKLATPPTANPTVNATATKASDSNSDDAKKNPARDGNIRKFTFHYRFRVKGLMPTTDAEQNDLVRIWLPCPANSDWQKIKRLDASVPGDLTENTETKYGNRILYFQTPIPSNGEFTVDIPYDVVRHEVLGKVPHPPDRATAKIGHDKPALFLGADSLVPTTGKPLKMREGIKLREDKLGLARQLYDIVDEHVTYNKVGTGWGRGDTNWVCESGYGNCTDFHSLFISLARSQSIPARFEIGFSIPTDKSEGSITGYHCWAWFYINDQGWIPVDISEADKAPGMKDYYFGNLTADRVMFSVGRDLELIPKPVNGPLNFFVYPHIELNGKILPATNVELQFEFKDQIPG